jgi:hypothetical protein
MSVFFQRHGRVLLMLIAAMSIALRGCGSSGATTNAGAANNGGATDNGAAANGVANNGGAGLGGAAAAFANMSSYQFNMTLAGGTFGSLLSVLGGASASSGGAMTVTGTIVLKPEKAADITVIGIHMIEVGGFTYMDLGTGQFMKSASTSSSLADSFAPATMFSSAVDTSVAGGYNKVGSEDKNGVSTDHYQASTTALSAYQAMLGSELGGATNVTWSADVWIANSGDYAGCPVSMLVEAKTSDGTAAYEVAFDLSKINDAGNKVTAPTNVMGG